MASDVSVKENSVHILMRLKPRVKFIINEMICTISYVKLTHSAWMCAEDFFKGKKTIDFHSVEWTVRKINEEKKKLFRVNSLRI